MVISITSGITSSISTPKRQSRSNPIIDCIHILVLAEPFTIYTKLHIQVTMSSTSTPHTNASTSRTSTSSTPTYTAPPSYAPSDASSVKSTTSTVKKHLVEVFTRKLNARSTATPTRKGPSGKDGLTTEERKLRNEARASYYSTLG
ncbi:hypothetical protein BU25DRAFT_158490 [Macroventuria anomochaeta]|uniref:Uncharacterized protein n=1 Tax=Macroventuria anomochaeta TaxID=301207 RepID=A0ACB6RQV7_9PLEO|nr:uncharacterized protein BU25DRAFT_158490 [Macroventuria anomochaeta]KAF2624350.1 hypothetical protein BU25DRAFT_158490 [Macroventuria anomochaeta]